MLHPIFYKGDTGIGRRSFVLQPFTQRLPLDSESFLNALVLLFVREQLPPAPQDPTLPPHFHLTFNASIFKLVKLSTREPSSPSPPRPSRVNPPPLPLIQAFSIICQEIISPCPARPSEPNLPPHTPPESTPPPPISPLFAALRGPECGAQHDHRGRAAPAGILFTGNPSPSKWLPEPPVELCFFLVPRKPLRPPRLGIGGLRGGGVSFPILGGGLPSPGAHNKEPRLHAASPRFTQWYQDMRRVCRPVPPHRSGIC